MKMNIDMNLRQAVIQRVQDKDKDDLFDIIAGSISGDERALPGLGVLFEIIWTHSEKETQQKLVATLKDHLQSSGT